MTLRDIKKERMILRLPTSATRNLFVSHLESHNMSIDEFHVVLEVDNIATIKDLIRRDFGVSILPKSVCLDELKKKKITVLPIENLSMIRETNMVYRPTLSMLRFSRTLPPPTTKPESCIRPPDLPLIHPFSNAPTHPSGAAWRLFFMCPAAKVQGPGREKTSRPGPCAASSF